MPRESTIESTLHCAGCDYDLRMIDPAGVCPECALPIEKSIEQARNPLGKSLPRLRWGAIVLLCAAGIRWLFLVILVVWTYAENRHQSAEAFVQLSSPWSLDELASSVIDLVYEGRTFISFLIVLWLLSFIVHIAGILMITARGNGTRTRKLAAIGGAVVACRFACLVWGSDERDVRVGAIQHDIRTGHLRCHRASHRIAHFMVVSFVSDFRRAAMAEACGLACAGWHAGVPVLGNAHACLIQLRHRVVDRGGDRINRDGVLVGRAVKPDAAD